MRNVSLYDNLALLLEDMADKYECTVSQLIEAIFDEMNDNDEEWKDHLAIIPYH